MCSGAADGSAAAAVMAAGCLLSSPASTGTHESLTTTSSTSQFAAATGTVNLALNKLQYEEDAPASKLTSVTTAGDTGRLLCVACAWMRKRTGPPGVPGVVVVVVTGGVVAAAADGGWSMMGGCALGKPTGVSGEGEAAPRERVWVRGYQVT